MSLPDILQGLLNADFLADEAAIEQLISAFARLYQTSSPEAMLQAISADSATGQTGLPNIEIVSRSEINGQKSSFSPENNSLSLAREALLELIEEARSSNPPTSEGTDAIAGDAQPASAIAAPSETLPTSSPEATADSTSQPFWSNFIDVFPSVPTLNSPVPSSDAPISSIPTSSSPVPSADAPISSIPTSNNPVPISVAPVTNPDSGAPVSNTPPSPPKAQLPFYFNALTEGVDYAAGELIVKFKAGVQSEEAVGFIQEEMGAVAIEELPHSGLQLLQTNSMSVSDAIANFSNHDLIEYIEPNFTITVQGTPNDPSYNKLWGLHNTGQTGGKADADIDAPEAWNLSTGQGVVVGVVDTGVDYNHPDLIDNMWKNPGEIAGDGIDNDGNGYIDDVYGYDFANDDGDPFDDHSHGTHVAGTIAARGNNDIGVIGVAPDAKIMALKFLGSNGSGFTFNAVRAIEYATMMGVNLTNNSWGGGGYSQALYNAIEAAGEQNQLFVVASGNDGKNGDTTANYPSNYDLDNIISVARTSHSDKLASSSNYGEKSVDLGAPGSNIYSTTPKGKYGSKSGTSMASPHVAGAAALVWAQNPSLTAQEVKDKLLNSVDPVASLAGKTVTGGRLNAFQALDSGGGSGGGSGGSGEIVPAALDYLTGFEAGSLTSEWSESTTFEGRARVTDDYAKSGSYSLLLDDSVDGGNYSTSAAILHLDPSDVFNAQLDFSWLDLGDESNAGLDGVFVSNDSGTTWTEIYSLTGGSSSTWTDVSLDLGSYLQPATESFQIKFQQHDNYSAPLDGIAIDEIKVSESVEAASADYGEDFESGEFGSEWTKDGSAEGRVRITDDYAKSGSSSLLLDDSVDGGDYATSAAILHLDTSDLTEATLKFSWLDLGDESHAGSDGVFVSGNGGTTWTEIYSLTGGSSTNWTDVSLDLGSYLQPSENFQIKFQQYDNYSAPLDGIAIDDIKVEKSEKDEPVDEPNDKPVVEPLPSAAIPKFKDSFEFGLDVEWTQETTNDGLVEITGARAYKGTKSMLLRDAFDNGDSSTAAAILHLDARNFSTTDLQLNFRWLDLANEYDAGVDGVFISEDGTDWHEVYAFDVGSEANWTLGAVDLTQQASNFGLNLHNGNFQIKFQQHDSYSSSLDGVAIDLVKVVPA